MSTGKFAVILADPPWHYEVFKPGTKLVHKVYVPGYDEPQINRPGVYDVAVPDYATMSPEELRTLPIASMAAPDAVLFMWATMPCLPEAFELMHAWGFTYKTAAFTWVKTDQSGKVTIKGMGHYTMSNAELCLIGTRGSPERRARNVPQVILAPRREHSRKPDEQYERIMRLYDGPYLELFARQQWPGWDVWGDQAGKFPAQPFLFGEEVAG